MLSQQFIDFICQNTYNNSINNWHSRWREITYNERQSKAYDRYHSYSNRYSNTYYNATYIGHHHSREYFQNEVDREYEQKFSNIILPQCERVWQIKLKVLNFPGQLNSFFERHPWLYAYAPIDTSELIENYIKPIIESSIAKSTLIFCGHSTHYGKATASEFTISWPLLDEQKFLLRMHDYPLNFIYNKNYDLFHLLPSLKKSWALMSNRNTYSFSRIDVYKLLFIYFGIKAQVLIGSNQNTQLVADIMPVEWNEIPQLDSNSKIHCRAWLINISTLDNPYWILLDKHNERNSLYICAEMDKSLNFQSKLNTIKAAFKVDDIVSVVNECDSAYTFIPQHLLWQYQLFARVLPYCLQNPRSNTLDNFRNKIPFYHLMSFVWESLIDNSLHEFDSKTTKYFQYALPYTPQSWLQLFESKPNDLFAKEEFNSLRAKAILTSVDQKDIEFIPDEYTVNELKLKAIIQDDKFLQACFMLGFSSVSHAMFTLTEASKKNLPDLPRYIFDKCTEKLTCVSFSIEHKAESKEEIGIGNLPPLVHLSNSAACNRLLLSNNKGAIAELKMDTRWEDAGRLVYLLFREAESALGQQSIQNYLEQEKKWRKDWFHLAKAPTEISFAWRLAQFAQMGRLGLDALFGYLRTDFLKSWHAIHQTPQLNLIAVFDLNGDHLLSAAQYIDYLGEELSQLIYDERCIPKFKAIHFILPYDFSLAAQKGIVKLIQTMSDYKYTHYEETEAFYFYDFNTHSVQEQESLLHQLENLATQIKNPLIATIRITALDEEVSDDAHLKRIKSRYRVLQNQILDNQRLFQAKKLANNTQILYQGADGSLDPMVDIRNFRHHLKQPFEEKEETILLSSQSLGIQQELQQNIEARHEIARQIEKKAVVYEEKAQDIKPYDLDLKRLITRHNINERLKTPNTSVNWEQQFSLWVGSDSDASYLINYIEPEAVNKIRQYSDFFQLGMVKNHLVFGFFLANHPEMSHSFILRYDEDRAKREQYEWEAKTKEQRNPFLIHLDEQAKPLEFDGDYRQFNLLGDKTVEQVSIWYHLATQSLSAEQRQKQAQLLRQVSHKHCNPNNPNIPVLMSAYEVSGQFNYPCTIPALKKQLSHWGAAVLHSLSEQAFSTFFFSSLNHAQLRSFGQLCYHYDSKKIPSGSSHFLRLALIVHQNFGQQYFKIWQNAILSPSKNFTELLEKPLLDAMGLSLITLKDKSPVYTNIWFQLLEAQSLHTGWVRYDRLWYAYQLFISYIDSKGLHLDRSVVERLLCTITNFQVVIWLDRLLFCLKMMEGQLYETQAQQHLLDNLNKVDWQESGLFYAMNYSGMPYWSNDLKLEKLMYSDSEKPYVPSWDKGIRKEAVVTAFSRYLAAQVRINFNLFQHYIHHVKPHLEQSDVSFLVARLVLITLRYGVESISDWSSDHFKRTLKELGDKNIVDVIEWWNKRFDLDQNALNSRYHILLDHLPLINRVLKGYGLEKLKLMSQDEVIALFNALGKTCQYLDSQSLLESPKAVHQLLQRVNRSQHHKLYLTAMSQTPWLIINSSLKNWPFSKNPVIYACQKRLMQQLESISYTTSTWLPSRKEIIKTLLLLDGRTLPIEDIEDRRRRLIDNWVQQGCAITEPDAKFRVLTAKEKENFLQKFTDQLLPQYIKENSTLMTKLLPNLVIEANFNPIENTVTQFILQCRRIDNKPHFNDLGIVLGTLIQETRQNNAAKISLQQVTEILDSLMLETHEELTHFPSDMLSELVVQTGNQLISSSLNELSAHFEPALKAKVLNMMHRTIPHPIKMRLLSLAPKFVDDNQFIRLIEHFVRYTKQNISIEYQIELVQTLSLIDSSLANKEQLDTLLLITDDQEIQALWLKSRLQLLKEINKAGSAKQLYQLVPLLLNQNQQKPELEIIGINTIALAAQNASQLRMILEVLNKQDLKKLAQYCSHLPIPSADYLIKNLPYYGIDRLIYHFETVEQAKNLRNYSVTPADKEQLLRILSGIKEKNTGFISDDKQKQIIGLLYQVNAFAQEQNLAILDSNELKNKLRHSAQCLQNTRDADEKRLYRLQLVGMLRELLVRQTGKWVNHTQMLALIYALLHNDESMFYQIKTGQGKSLITIMRVAFHALNGKVVDIFTAKESLSSRDHEEFAYILDAIGIEHTHIVPNSNEYEYQVGDDVFGAVNYLTPSSFSLFQSGHCWSESSKRYINYRTKARLAFFDEGDHVLLDEQTMFNFSYNAESNKLYNYDAWVYNATWRYFQSIKETIPLNEKGIPFITRSQHLAQLCECIQQNGDYAPIQSTFVKTYLAPVVDEDIKDKTTVIKARDKMLAGLLSAAFTANNLLENQEYCIQDTMTILGNQVSIKSRSANVVINNQVQEGATFSERVHQFLHVRLNEKALARGEQPNFFITPDSSIVLSQNVPALITQYYDQIEGLSGTMGDAGELRVFRERFNIQYVIKLPTHEISQTKYKGMIFCDGQIEHEQRIVDCLTEHCDQPTLLVSKDDIEVKTLSARLPHLLPKAMASHLICDTNDSGRNEKDILPHAGKAGCIINSSRMARGTDIKPQVDQGLLVIRSNPSMPRTAKQSGGRQGRNGGKGTLIDIFNFELIRKEYENFAHSTVYAGRLHQLMERERDHLYTKFTKYNKKHSKKWHWLINDPEKQEQYLKTRAVQCLKHETKILVEQNIRCKEALVAKCSSHVIVQLMYHIVEDQTVMRLLRKEWLNCRELIESAWQQRMIGALEDNEEVLDVFYEKAKLIWQQFAAEYPEDIDASLLNNKEELFSLVRSLKKSVWNKGDDQVEIPEPTQLANMPDVIEFYQHWITKVADFVTSYFPKPLQDLFYGKSNTGLSDLNRFYQALIKASQTQEYFDNQTLIQNTPILFQELKSIPFPQMSTIPLRYMTDVVNTLSTVRIDAHFVEKLSCLTRLFKQECFLTDNVLCEHQMITAGEVTQFLMRLACQGFSSKNTKEFRRFTTGETLNTLTHILWQHFWPTVMPDHFACFNRLITHTEIVAKLLTTHLSQKHWHKLLSQLSRYTIQLEDIQYLDRVRQYFETNHHLLNNDHSTAIDALLELFFKYPHRRVDPRYFPAPNSLIYASSDINIQFIHFISEHYMLTAIEVQQLVKIINDSFADNKFGAARMLEKVIPQILVLPPNIPFSMIQSRIEHTANNQNLEGFNQSMAALTQVGNALNHFTQQKNITTQENSLPAEGESEALLGRAQAFILQKNHSNHLYDASVMLEQISSVTYDLLDANTCLMAIEQYNTHYQEPLALLLRAKKAMEPNVYSLFFTSCFTVNDNRPSLSDLTLCVCLFEQQQSLFATLTAEKRMQQLAVIQQFFTPNRRDTVLKKIKILDGRQMNFENSHVWQQWQSHPEDCFSFDEKIQCIKETDGLSHELSESLCALLDAEYNSDRLLVFIRLAQKDKKTPDPITTEQLLHILNKWQNGQIQEGIHLKNVFEAQKLANILATETSTNDMMRRKQGIPTFEDLFGVFNKNNQGSLRVHLMHSITHSLIHCSNELHQKCWTFYHLLMAKVGNITIQMEQLSKEKRSVGLSHILRSLKGLCIELFLVAKTEQAMIQVDNQKLNFYYQLVTSLENQYIGRRSKQITVSSIRKQQALGLFSGLKDIANPQGLPKSPAVFYKSMLDLIDRLQETVIEHDPDNKLNSKKGYCHLFDISQQLGLQLCKDLSNDPALNYATKKLAQDWLLTQEKRVVHQLWQRLPSSHPIVHEIAAYARNIEHPSEIAVHQCQLAIAKLQSSDLPKELRYLLPLLKGHFEITEDMECKVNRVL